ncbi:cytochrome P450 [Aspergillus steynii IBT 23096]|uniref:Cytochrome P450 n=1 Tax=Aspergillus steynii IBT 23096 TaxID=1392250 RepID=A0A2I2GDM6_9EURO|nr:cytochrome P450 [Aspergillus steynii IBT 23096]PLB50941.1 cytochrome P450 [Aspergillus steynii IBT 23096]
MSFVVLAGLCAVALVVVQLLRTRYNALYPIPGPFLASFCNFWKVSSVYRHQMHVDNVAAHDRYGPVVRIGPHHVSVSSPEAFSMVHAARSAFPKTEFYEVGAPSYRGGPLENLFSIRNVQYHSSLRKNIGGLYTKSAVKEFEPQIANCVALFLRRMREEQGKALNMSLWLHLYAYDSLADVNVSEKLGFLEQGSDVNGMIAAADRIFVLVGLLTQAPILHLGLRLLRSLMPAENSEPLIQYSFDKVEQRQKSLEKKPDMLNKFLSLHEAQPEKVSVREIKAAIFINLMAGHDVLAITLRAIWYYLAQNPRVAKILRAEIAGARQAEGLSEDDDAQLSYATASSLPYLDAVLIETMRVHPNTGTILERKVPASGVTIDGYHLPPDTTVGVNAWVLHRNPTIFGADADTYRPERWLEATPEQKVEMKKYIFTFGAGPHTCIGQHIAMIQIVKVVAEFFHRFDVELTRPDQPWKVMGSWVTKQTEMEMRARALEQTSWGSSGAVSLTDKPEFLLLQCASHSDGHFGRHLSCPRSVSLLRSRPLDRPSIVPSSIMSDASAEPQFPPGYMEANNGNQVIAATTFTLVLTTILLGMRLYARSLTDAARGWDEFLLVPSYLCCMGLMIVLYVDVIHAGLGRHAASVMAEDPHKIVVFLQLLYTLDWLYVVSSALSRVSVLSLYLRIFTNKLYRGVCWFMIGFVLSAMLATILAAQLECFPLAYAWDKTIPNGHCFNQVLWYQLTNLPNIFIDLVILVLPIPTVWNLKASSSQKFRIAGVFLLGSLGLFGPCVRTAVFFRDGDVIRNDPTWSSDCFSWTAVECGMYFSAACLIGMRPLFAKLPRWLRGHVWRTSNRTTGQDPRTGTGISFKKSQHRPYANLSGRDTQQGTQLKSMNGMTSTIVSMRGSGYDDDSVRNLVTDEGDIRVQTRIEVKSDQGGY